MPDEKDILVLGDYAADIFLYAERWREKSLYVREAPSKDYPFHLITVPGGAGAFVTYLPKLGFKAGFPGKEKAFQNWYQKGLESVYVLQRTPGIHGPVWRMYESRSALPWGEGRTATESKELQTNDFEECQYVTVMDFGGGWRDKQSGDGQPNWQKLAAGIKDKPYLIRSADPLHPAWRAFRKEMAKADSSRPGIWVGVTEDLDEGALRRPGIWEDHVDRVVNHLKKDPTLFSTDEPRGWQHVVAIRIDYDGALVVAPGSDEYGDLFIFPGDQPGSFLRANPGHVVGGGIAFVASFVEALTAPHYPDRDEVTGRIDLSDQWIDVLHAGAKDGLARSRKVMETGYLDPEEMKWPTISTQEISILKHDGTAEAGSVVPYRVPKEDWHTACEIVYGDESQFRKNTLLRIGELVTAAPRFAQGLLDLALRLRNHADTGKKILSFAIFGEPGSGKSFVAKSLQKAIDPDGKIFKRKSYNVSQFGGDRERLVDAFNAVSQTSLQGKTPFVLWDEFDCGLPGEGKCAWLQEFLMPMEDAEFNEGKEVRKLGRCVFVFMGGIHEDGNDFIEWIEADETKEQAKLLKAPDFHSRLERTLHIPSVEVPAESKSINKPHPARLTRAILMRRFLAEELYENINSIEENVLAYLLHVPLRHGVRSLKKIIEASTLDKTTVFRLSHLPSADVLGPHVHEPHVEAFLSGLAGASKLGDEALQLRWRRYKPKAIHLYTDALDKAERDLTRYAAAKSHERFAKDLGYDISQPCPAFSLNRTSDRCLAEFDKERPVEKEQYEEAARSEIRRKRGHKDDDPPED